MLSTLEKIILIIALLIVLLGMAGGVVIILDEVQTKKQCEGSKNEYRDARY